MMKYRTETQEVEVAESGSCNKCGEALDMLYGNFITIDYTYGFGSKKDMSHYTAHICETCMDEFYETFVIPPDVVNQW